jgi:hypothetical protein
MTRRAGIVAALVMGLATAGAHAGQGASPTFFTNFERESGKFWGKIDSAKGKCVKGRKIILIRKRNGEKKSVGSDKTNDNGKFSIEDGGANAGSYFAKADGTGDCQAAKSVSVSIG